MGQQRILFISLIAVLCLFASACGSSDVTSTNVAEPNEVTDRPDGGSATTVGQDDSSEPGAAAIDLSTAISEQDLGEARAVLDGARVHWDGLEPFAYTMRVGFEAVNAVEIDFAADGSVAAERVVLGDPDDQSFGPVPRSVGEVFDLIDNAIATFESGEFAVPPASGCGNHFNALFDAELGAPMFFDTLGPCDDGVGLRMVVTPAGENPVDDGPVLEQGFCDQSALVGEWLSPRAAGTEPLAEDDGVFDEGGAGVVVLTLGINEASLQSSDTVEVFGEWFCTASTVIGITSDGQERQLATIDSDGTLTSGDWTLTKADG